MSEPVKEAFHALLEDMEDPPTWEEISVPLAHGDSGLPRRRPVWVFAASIAIVLALGMLAVLLVPSRSPTADELDTAVSSAVDKLTASPAVQGIQKAYVLEYRASSVWFDFRPSTGDSVVVQQVDQDVTEFPWWLTESGTPWTTGRNIETTAFLQADGSVYAPDFSDDPSDMVWSLMGDAPRVPLALGMRLLTEERHGLDVSVEDGDVMLEEFPDSSETWTVTTQYQEGSAMQTWQISPSGELESWVWELEGVEPSLDGGAGPFTSGRIDYVPVSDPDPFPTPGAVADLSEFDLPEDFSLED